MDIYRGNKIIDHIRITMLSTKHPHSDSYTTQLQTEILIHQKSLQIKNF